MKKKEIVLMLISLICPIIGIILYFVYKKDKGRKSSILKGIFAGIFIYSIIVLYSSTHSTDYFNRDINRWKRDVSAGNTVVTVIGASYCEHCQEYKPIIKALANKNHINLYFYEIDTLTEKEQDTLTTTFYLPSYQGKVPYTFIMQNGEFVDSYEGFQSQSEIVAFLLQYGIIKN